MGDSKISSNFVQKVFDEISLERNMELWMSADDTLLQDRLELLSSHEQTMFFDHLFDPKKRQNLAKNAILATGFKNKAEKLMANNEWKQALHLLNISLTFAPEDKTSQILLLRAETMDNLDIMIKSTSQVQLTPYFNQTFSN